MVDIYKAARIAGAGDLKAEFSRRLRARLEELGMNQTDLADATGLSKDAISTYARNRSLPGKDSLARIASALHVKPDDLVPKTPALDEAGSAVSITMIGGGQVRIRVDTELPLDAATRILGLIDEAAHTEGGR